MSADLYPAVVGDEDDGTMPENVATLADAIVGHRIVKVERNVETKVKRYGYEYDETVALLLTLDTGRTVSLSPGGDCCAYTTLEDLIEHLPATDHIITAVRPDDDYTTWHILADLGEVLEMQVGWSAGNPFYYSYGFGIDVKDVDPMTRPMTQADVLAAAQARLSRPSAERDGYAALVVQNARTLINIPGVGPEFWAAYGNLRGAVQRLDDEKLADTIAASEQIVLDGPVYDLPCGHTVFDACEACTPDPDAVVFDIPGPLVENRRSEVARRESEGCTGASDCGSLVHVHGCYAEHTPREADFLDRWRADVAARADEFERGGSL
jgi:hypothetical protein